MNDVERVKGFGKTLKAFQNIADQLNDIADLQAMEKEAKRLTENARSELRIANELLNGVNDKLKEAVSLREAAYVEKDTVDKNSKEQSNHILSEAKRKAEDMIKNSHDAADQIRHTNKIEMTNLQKKKIQLETDLENVQNQVDGINKILVDLERKFK